MSETIPHPPQPELKAQSSNTDEAVFFGIGEETTMNLSPGQSHALFMKIFAEALKSKGLRSPQYYEDKSQCTSFTDIKPVEKACLKAANLKSGFIEPKDLIERLRQLKPSGNFELREYKHPPMSWVKSPLCHEYPPDLKEDPPIWVSEKDCQLSQLLGDRRAKPFQDWLEEHWKKIELSLNRTPLPDLHLLKNIGSSPNGTLYPRYLVQGLHSLRDSVEDKASLSYEKNGTKAEKELTAAVLDWEERHPDIKLNHELTCMFRTWPSDLKMDKLDEIDRQTAWSGRRIYIELLVEAEKQMQELIKFWKDCELISGQRTPPSPAIRSPDSLPESPPQIGRESGENQSRNGSLSSPPTQAGSSQLQTKVSGPATNQGRRSSFQNLETSGMSDSDPAQKPPRQVTRQAGLIASTKIKLSEPRNIWDERLRPRTKTAKA